MDLPLGQARGTEMALQAILDAQRRDFAAMPKPSAADRQAQLRHLETLLRQNQRAIADAISEDFGQRSRVETATAEIMPLLAAAAHARRHVRRWMQPVRRSVGLSFRPASNRVEFQPLGVVGVMAPWNYPVLLTLGPLIDILAAGNRAMLKPSELTPRTAALLARLVAETFPAEQVAVVTGGPDTARAFAGLPFDHLVFTGSASIGREVMRAAAENLVPVTLELGGKSPVIVAADYNVAAAARSVALGKFFNAGQTCVAPDYALVPAASAEPFGRAVIAAAEASYPSLAANPDVTSLIAEHHVARLNELVQEAEAAGATLIRHEAATTARLFPPTVVLDPPPDGRLMRDEIFGPVLPVLRTQDLEEAIGFVEQRPLPLALYLYTHDAAAERTVLDRTRSGGVTLNSTVMHAAQADLPFGGIGPSGMGAYHGHDGFLRFCHARGVHRKGAFSMFETMRPPHGKSTLLALKSLGIEI